MKTITLFDGVTLTLADCEKEEGKEDHDGVTLTLVDCEKEEGKGGP